jgi:hypothetical protein
MKKHQNLFAAFLAVIASNGLVPGVSIADTYYTEEKTFSLRPNSASTKEFGHIGPTGILATATPNSMPM